MTTLSIALNDDDHKFIESVVKSGRYDSESEVVAEALSELKIREAVRRAKITDLSSKIKIGIEEADAGHFADFTAADIKKEGRERLQS